MAFLGVGEVAAVGGEAGSARRVRRHLDDGCVGDVLSVDSSGNHVAGVDVVCNVGNIVVQCTWVVDEAVYGCGCHGVRPFASVREIDPDGGGE